MTKTKHTQGEWEFAHNPLATFSFIGNGEIIIAGIPNTKIPSDLEESLANAQLMIAAPELLTACQAMIEEYEDGRNIQPFEIRELCRSAIAKATGKGGD